MDQNPALIFGGQNNDHRGRISFVNAFSMDAVKRFYVIEQKGLETVRAWIGHKKEQKWFYAISGSFKMVVIKPDNWENPDPRLEPIVFELSKQESNILHVPGGHAVGFKALEEHSKLIVYSDFTIEASMKDDYRFHQDLWYKW